MNDAVVTEDIGRVRVIKMNRPDALNSMNPWMFMGIRDALHGAAPPERALLPPLSAPLRRRYSGARTMPLPRTHAPLARPAFSVAAHVTDK